MCTDSYNDSTHASVDVVTTINHIQRVNNIAELLLNVNLIVKL